MQSDRVVIPFLCCFDAIRKILGEVTAHITFVERVSSLGSVSAGRAVNPGQGHARNWVKMFMSARQSIRAARRIIISVIWKSVTRRSYVIVGSARLTCHHGSSVILRTPETQGIFPLQCVMFCTSSRRNGPVGLGMGRCIRRGFKIEHRFRIGGIGNLQVLRSWYCITPNNFTNFAMLPTSASRPGRICTNGGPRGPRRRALGVGFRLDDGVKDIWLCLF